MGGVVCISEGQAYRDPNSLTASSSFDTPGKGSEQMDFDATQAWCNDLSVELDDVIVFGIAELTKAPTMGYFDRKAWIEGWRSVKKDTVAAQKEHLSSVRNQLTTNPDYFKKVYQFCFEYAKESGQKSLCKRIMYICSTVCSFRYLLLTISNTPCSPRNCLWRLAPPFLSCPRISLRTRFCLLSHLIYPISLP